MEEDIRDTYLRFFIQGTKRRNCVKTHGAISYRKGMIIFEPYEKMTGAYFFIDKKVGTASKFSPLPTYNVDNRIIFSFFDGKARYFPTLIRGKGGYPAQVSQPFLSGIVGPGVRKSTI